MSRFEYYSYAQQQNEMYSQMIIWNKEMSWLKTIIRERTQDGFNKKLGHGNAVELDQSKWMYHSTHFRNNHKIRIQEEIWLFGAIERV